MSAHNQTYVPPAQQYQTNATTTTYVPAVPADPYTMSASTNQLGYVTQYNMTTGATTAYNPASNYAMAAYNNNNQNSATQLYSTNTPSYDSAAQGADNTTMSVAYNQVSYPPAQYSIGISYPPLYSSGANYTPEGVTPRVTTTPYGKQNCIPPPQNYSPKPKLWSMPKTKFQPLVKAKTAFQPTRNISTKSSLSELHNLATSSGQNVEWIQESEIGPAHDKLFSMKVVMGVNEATGSGKSKKIAKQVAAETLLKQLQGDRSTENTVGYSPESYGPQLPTNITTTTTQQLPSQPSDNNTATTTITTTSVSTPPPPGTTTTPLPNLSHVQDNAVSKLQQVAVKHKLGSPQYEVVCADGATALQKFDVRVKVQEMETAGLGRSKKTAKRNAAQAMLDQLSKSNIKVGPPQKRMMFVPASVPLEKPF